MPSMADLLVHHHPLPDVRLQPSLSARRSGKGLAQPSRSSTRANLLSRTVARQVRSVSDLFSSWRDGLDPGERHLLREREQQRQLSTSRMREAETFQQWDAAARDLDTLDGNESWKQEPVSSDYNSDLIEQRLQALDDARASGDIQSMMHLIRTALSRELGGTGNVDLYRHSYKGTKRLIERYVESAIETIETVVSQGSIKRGSDTKDLLEGMLFSRQSFGRSALLLSGGGTFGMSHIGVLKALFEARLLPRIISGASAGSIVCSVMCTRTDEEIPEMLRQFPFGDLSVFEAEDCQDGFLGHLRRLLTEGSWSDIQHLTRVMRGLTGDMTFQEAYNRTRRILNICVSTPSVYELPRLLNYVTAPNVVIWSAVAASCSVPLVFNSSALLVKDVVTNELRPWNPTPQHFIDGSVDNDLPMTRLAEMFNVNHFIVSQVNPHVVPFLSKDDYVSPLDQSLRTRFSQTSEFDWVYTLTSVARDEALHRLHFMAEMGIMPNLASKLQSILSQKYSGDITILPEISMNELSGLLKNPTIEFMQRSCLLGERATWPKLSRIRDRCAIELALDRAVHRLRARVVFAGSQRDLRRLHTSEGDLRTAPSIRPGPPMSGSVRQRGAAEPKRHRRSSGGSMYGFSDRHAALRIGNIGHDSSDAEGRPIHFVDQAGQGTAMEAPGASALARPAKSHSHVWHHGKASYDGASAGRQPSKSRRGEAEHQDPEHLDAHIRGEGASATLGEYQASQLLDGATSPTDDAETSEQCMSSDADSEHVTGESELDTSDSILPTYRSHKADAKALHTQVEGQGEKP